MKIDDFTKQFVTAALIVGIPLIPVTVVVIRAANTVLREDAARRAASPAVGILNKSQVVSCTPK